MASDEKMENLCVLLKEKAHVEAVPCFDENGNITDMVELTPAWFKETTCFKRSGNDIPAEERQSVWEEFNSGDSMNSVDFCLRFYNSFAKSYSVLGWEPISKPDWDSECGRKGRPKYKLTDDESVNVLATVIKAVETAGWNGNIPALYTAVCEAINDFYTEKVEKNAPKKEESDEDSADEKASYRKVFNAFKARIGELVESDEVLQKLITSISVEEQEKLMSHFKVSTPKARKEKAEKPAFVRIKPTELTRLPEVMSKESANLITQVLAQLSMTPAGEKFVLTAFPKLNAKLLGTQV